MSRANRLGRMSHVNRMGVEVTRKKLLSGKWTKPQEDFFLLALVHDLLPWRDEDCGMTLNEIRAALAELGHPISDRQLRYCLSRGADVLQIDIDSQVGKRQYWKRSDPSPLCAMLWEPDRESSNEGKRALYRGNDSM